MGTLGNSDSPSKELTILSEEEGVVVAMLEGDPVPVAVLGKPVMDIVWRQWREARLADRGVDPIAMEKLHASVGLILMQYSRTCNKYGSSGGEADRELVIAELDQLARMLRELRPGGPLPDSVKCGFCGRGHLRVQRLIEGTSAAICGDCIKECWGLLNESFEA
jgi:hypothetical protein